MPFEGSLPTTLNFSVPGMDSKTLLNVFDAAGMRISAGSACSAAKAEPSYVLQAMGLPAWQTEGAVRLSIGATADAAFIDEACARIAVCGQVLRACCTGAAPVNGGPAISIECGSDGGLSADALGDFFQRHPDARMVDVRDVAEHQASHNLLPWTQASTLHVPLEALRHSMPADLSQALGPVVMFCRSGARSRQAAALLRARGHTQVWHLEGGVALAEMA